MFFPKNTTGAFVYSIYDNVVYVLLQQRSKELGHTLSYPSGITEYNDSYMTSLDELREEVGILPSDLEFKDVIYSANHTDYIYESPPDLFTGPDADSEWEVERVRNDFLQLMGNNFAYATEDYSHIWIPVKYTIYLLEEYPDIFFSSQYKSFKKILYNLYNNEVISMQ